MQGEWRPLVNYPKSALLYAALDIIPAAFGLLAVHGGYLRGAVLMPALVIAVPQFIYSFIFSMCCLLAKQLKAATWYFAMALIGIALATGPSLLAKYVFKTG